MHGDIAWIDNRPVLVIQADLLDDAPTVIVLPVTVRQPQAAWPFNVLIPAHSAGLPTPAWARLTQPRTVQRETLTTPVGTVDADTLNDVQAGLALILNIDADLTPTR